ncbi:ABC transporter substrate-binding protein [Hymenobacter sp. J193]|uniref:ABC transporter substrate-binding protein n=1 Tax=Hymenobacter sp. J193 TaxID=2898429 RepID=UPI002150BA0C|nr:ABC transporter substrate-binding protein [Hymenobacter sp. J193]MCR5888759.1 ABC transporter substrate-binding protein [Hymenobacter sp. J193]
MLGLWFRSALLVLLLGACKPTPPPAAQVRIRWPRDPESLHPHMLANAVAVQAINLTYQSLLAVDAPRQQLVPLLADSLPAVRRTGSASFFSYRIRPQATWDDGQPILAADVAFSLRAMRCPGLPNERMQAQYGFIRDITISATDPRRFTLVCAPYAPDYRMLSGDFAILPEHLLDSAHTLRLLPLTDIDSVAAARPAVAAVIQRLATAGLERSPGRYGSGPYQLKTWQTGQQLTLQRKRPWWGDALQATVPQLTAHPEQIRFQIIPDQTAALLALRRQEIDVYAGIPPADFARLRQSAADTLRLGLYTPDSYEMVTAGFNTRRPVLRQALTRQAISSLFDVEGILNGALHQQGYASVSMISPQQPSFYNDSLPADTFNPAAAIAYLQQAGWRRRPDGSWWQAGPDGKPMALGFTIAYRAGNAAYEFIALQVRTAAARLGIAVQLRPAESAQLTQQLQAGEFDVYLRSVVGNPFAHNFIPLLHSASTGTAGGNYTGFGSPASDRLLEQLAAAEDTLSKRKLLRQFQRVLQRERPLRVLYFMRNPIAVSKRFTNLGLSSLSPGYEVAGFVEQPKL